MIAMPYIVVDIVFSGLSPLFFSITSAALLSRHPFANLWLPARIRNRRIFALAANALALSVLSLAAVHVIAGIDRKSTRLNSSH